MSGVEYILLFGSVLFGGLLGLYFGKSNAKWLESTLAFGGSYILGITVLHLLPIVFQTHGHDRGIYILGGFLLQLLLEQLTRGVEHGHIHAHSAASSGFGLSILLGLSVHAFVEGLPLGSYIDLQGLGGHGHEVGHNHLLWGVVLHKAPAAFALVILLLLSGFSRLFVLISMLVFAVMSPLGSAVSEYMAIGLDSMQNILAVVVGSFLHISTTIIFESDSGKHRISYVKLVVILIGITLALATLIH